MRRINVNVNDLTEAMLDECQELERITVTEIIRQAVSLYWTARKALHEGDTLYIRKADGTYERILLP